MNTLSLPERTRVAITQLRAKPNADSAHLFRTSYRRLQTWLGTENGNALGRRQRRALKYLDKVLRACGKLRDTELHLKMLRKLEVENDATSRNVIQRVLNKRRSTRKEDLLDVLQRQDKVEELWTALQEIAQRHQANGNASGKYLVDALQEYRRYVQDRSSLSEGNLHEYRLACKEFRYHAELAGQDSEAAVKLFKQVQDAIGEWHDWRLLLDLGKKKLRKAPSKLLTKIEETTAAKLAEALRVAEETEPQLLREAREESPKKSVQSVADVTEQRSRAQTRIA